jgi:AcrR family transcriptional regulator
VILREVEGWELRAERTRSGLTLHEVARAAGTSVSNVAAYERGDKRARDHTVDRLLAMIRIGAQSPIHRSSLMTVPATAAAIRADLRSGAGMTSDTLRFVREMVRNASEVIADVADRTAFFVEPSTTGDRRWNALLAGVVDDLARRHGFAPPAWIDGHSIRPFWFVGSSPGLHAYAYAHSPTPLALRGVFIDPADLESV